MVLIAGGTAALLLRSHQSPSAFALSTPSPASSGGGLGGKWVVGTGSEAGYRVREKFINQPASTEAVARTTKVSGSLQVRAAGSVLTVTSMDFGADLTQLVSQDKYATFQAFQRDSFIRSIYLQTDLYPKAEFRADSAQLPGDLTAGPLTLDVTGRLALHGETRPATAHVQVQLNGSSVEVVGSITVDMRDYNISVPDISFTKAEPTAVIEYHLIFVRA